MKEQGDESKQKEGYSFFAMLSRMKYIERWALMRNSMSENISEHSLEVSMLSHLLAVISNRRFHNCLNAERAALLGLYHDATEILTGDMPTPIKYYNRDIREAFQKIEDNAARRLLAMLPEDLRQDYEELFFVRSEDEKLQPYVKAADKLSALIKCIEEEKVGNTEFLSAKAALLSSVEESDLPEVQVFLTEFLPAYGKNLDELQENPCD